MAFSHSNALYLSAVNTPISDYSTSYGTRANALFSPSTSPNGPSTAASALLTVPGRPMTGGPAEAISEEQAFAAALQQFMDGADMHSTLSSFAATCTKHSKALRAEALRYQHRAARHMHLHNEATALEAEAATWKLLVHLYAQTNVTYPAGCGGQETALPTVHHQVADLVANDVSLLQCARVVAWLEELASETLVYVAEQSQGPRFNKTSGVWLNTRAALQSNDQHVQTVTALDPDAPTRQKCALSIDSARNEDMLNTYLFQLVKAGRVSEACSTCMEAGQPWHAASLQGGGMFGPIPLGPAAEQQQQANLTEQLASEVEANSHIAMRSLWKWACFQVAEVAAEDYKGSAEVAGRHEAALHASLCGHLHSILPVCQTRADVLWAHSRSWLELQVDLRLSQDSGLTDGLRAGLDAAQAIKRSKPEQPIRLVLDDLADFWPPDRLVQSLPGTFEEAVAAAQTSADGKEVGDMAHWQLHQDIISQRFAQLLGGFQHQPSEQEASHAVQTALVDKAARARVGAHLALALAYLPIAVPEPQLPLDMPQHARDHLGQHDDSASQQHSKEDLRLQDCINQVLQQYVLHLMETQQHDLVPIYCCHLRLDKRRETYAQYMHRLTLLNSPEDCQHAYSAAEHWFRRWQLGDIDQKRELDIIAQEVVAQSFWQLEEGPMHWVAALRWLCYSETTLAQAIQQANSLLRQLSLAGLPGIQAAYCLLTRVLTESPILCTALADSSNMEALSNMYNELERDCLELNIWLQFYESERIYAQFHEKLNSPEEEDEEEQLEQLWRIGDQYIAAALQLCQSGDLQRIWDRQDVTYMENTPSHELRLWLAPAVAADCSSDVEEGRQYNLVPADRLKSFVSDVQATATACCPPGITAQVAEAEGMATLSLQMDHKQVRFGEDAQCLNAIIKAGSGLQVVRMQGPDSALGALASLAAHPYVLLRAAELRRILAELSPPENVGSVPGQDIVPTVAGVESDSTLGLTYYFTQSELQEMLECERLTQIRLLGQHDFQLSMSD